ncbi:TlpA disulfide reductase family protein [Chitinophaga sp. Cy-1792]|uniref:TlpA family protein disulfide reductase n=1 Tax=Chitinophaga sp. Cy-1792 TaxID=2608339 RepID=UPI00141F870A|nr:TlpA disulfide reductase family protein [Chitinophaga sp. Cy-1792]NIG56464.1 TlpA family protein disulfide reductase [Chitinophaga sp. Cy-1792]
MRYLLPLLLVVLLVASCQEPPAPPFSSGKEGERILNITYQLKDSASYATVDTMPGKAAVLFFLTTECPYCRAEVRALTEHADSLKHIQFYLLTIGKPADVKAYSDEFKLDKYPNISIGIDTGRVMMKYFGIRGVPYIAVYNKQHVLKQVFNSITPFREIRKVAEE